MTSQAQNKSMQVPAKYVKCVRQLIAHQVGYFTKPLPNPDLVKAHLNFEPFEEFHPVFLKKIKLDKNLDRKMFETALFQFRDKYSIRSIAVAEYFFYQSLISDMITQSFILYFATPDTFTPVLKRIINFMQTLYPETRQAVFGVKLRSWGKSLFSLLGDLVWLLDESAASQPQPQKQQQIQRSRSDSYNNNKHTSKWDQQQNQWLEQRLSVPVSAASAVNNKNTVKTPSPTPSAASNKSNDTSGHATSLKLPAPPPAEETINISGVKEIDEVVISDSPADNVEAIYDENKKQELNETSVVIAKKTLAFSNSTLNLQNVMMEDGNEEVANSANKVRRISSTNSTTSVDSLKLTDEEFDPNSSTIIASDAISKKSHAIEIEIPQVEQQADKKTSTTTYSNGSYEAEDCVPVLEVSDSEVDHYYYRHLSKPKFFKRQFTLEDIPEINFLNLQSQGDWFGQMLRTLLRDLKDQIENPLSFAIAIAALYYRQAFFHVWNKACREENTEIVRQLRTEYMYHLQYSYEILSHIKEITRAAIIAVRLYT